MSRIRTQPLLLSFLVLGFFLWFFFLVGRSGWSLSSSEALLGFALSLLVAASTCNACVTRYGGRWTIHPPPPLGLLS